MPALELTGDTIDYGKYLACSEYLFSEYSVRFATVTVSFWQRTMLAFARRQANIFHCSQAVKLLVYHYCEQFGIECDEIPTPERRLRLRSEISTAPNVRRDTSATNRSSMTLQETQHLSGNFPSSMPARIFIDESYTIGSGKSSGIERVVKNVLRECLDKASAGELPDVVPVISIGGSFYRLERAQIEEFTRTASFHRNATRHMSPRYLRFAKTLCGLIPHKKLEKWLLPQSGHLGIFKLKHTFADYRVRQRAASQCEKVVPLAGDLFLLPDAYWVNRLRASVWPAAAEARSAGAKVATLLYDLIPLTHPEFVGQERSSAFLDYLKRVATNSDLIVAISKTVRDDAKRFLKSIETPFDDFCSDIRDFELGAELQESNGAVRKKVSDVFDTSHPPYLMVATFDPRKNHPYLLDAFDRMWSENSDVNLCLVGRFGSQCDETIQRIQSHPEFGSRLHLFNDLTDAELHYCYRNARGVVFTSVVEGFGLPIVESLWHGQKTFASNTPIHREVGRDDCTYFDLDDPRNLIAAITEWEQKVRAGAKPTVSRKPTTWKQSAEELLAHCRSLNVGDQSKERAA